MNSYFALIVVAAAIIGLAQGDAAIKKLEEECAKETGVDLALINAIKGGRVDDTADLKCFPKCFFVKAKFMNENGDLDVEAIKAAHAKKPHRERREVVINECVTKKGANPCETGDLVFRCYWSGIHKAGLKD